MMNSEVEYPKLLFPDGFNDRDEWEMSRKGFVYAFVEFPENQRYKLFFIDPVRLQQEIEDMLRLKDNCYIEPAMVVVPEVTIEALERSIESLVKEAFFDGFLPISDDEIRA